MKLGQGWAPEKKEDEYSLFAILELRTLLKNIFDSPGKRGLRGPSK
jgi:hypothetical protein